jgi:hypothetical protein
MAPKRPNSLTVHANLSVPRVSLQKNDSINECLQLLSTQANELVCLQSHWLSIAVDVIQARKHGPICTKALVAWSAALVHLYVAHVQWFDLLLSSGCRCTVGMVSLVTTWKSLPFFMTNLIVQKVLVFHHLKSAPLDTWTSHVSSVETKRFSSLRMHENAKFSCIGF